MLVGIDLDNTIVRYDELFHKTALARRLIPDNIPAAKAKIRDYLRSRGKESSWTEMQGFAYGVGMIHAVPFPGVFPFLSRCKRAAVAVVIVTHRTRQPFAGPPCDLHQSAAQWLDKRGFFAENKTGLTAGSIYFELTKQLKMERIANLGCTHFIDDLPEFLSAPGFPPSTVRILFDPNRCCAHDGSFRIVHSWKGMAKEIEMPRGKS